MALTAKQEPIVTIEAVVIRADGKREDLGVIAKTEDPNWVKKFIDKLKGGNDNG